MSASAHRATLAAAMGLPVECFDRAGTTVVPGSDRVDSGLASHYRVHRHSVLWVDPAVVELVSAWNGRAEATSFDEMRAGLVEIGARVLGSAYEHVLAGTFDPPPRPSQIRLLDPDAGESSELVRSLNEVSSEDDRDQADFHPEALDRLLVGWVEDGHLLAVGGGRPFEPRPGFVDVGVLVHPEHRGRGLGRSVIAALVEEVVAAGQRPLYRCNVENEASWRLCRGLGFECVLELEAFTFAARDADS